MRHYNSQAYRELELKVMLRRQERERVLERYDNLFIGQTRRMKPLPPPLIDIKEGDTSG